MKRGLQPLLHDERGVAAIEFAFILPILAFLFLGIVEISNFVMVNQRTEKVAHMVADLVTQYEEITTNDLDTILAASNDFMNPFPFSERGHIIITAVHRNVNEGPEVAWQYEGGGELNELTSNFGSTGFASPLPDGFTLNERETVVIAEVYYDYAPFITHLFEGSSERLYKYAFYRPRLGGLTTVQTN